MKETLKPGEVQHMHFGRNVGRLTGPSERSQVLR
jgi:hypothetical protein